MGAGTDASPQTKTSRAIWRIGTPVVMLLGGALVVMSAQNSDGTALRPSTYTDIASIVEAESDELNALNQQATELNGQVDELSSSLGGRAVNRYQRRIERLEDPAGFTARTGPGVKVTLTDAPSDLIDSTSRDINELVVHQQDIQAVVNAMWRGGAEAVTIQGQRVISTTGIKCSGNTVQLQGVPYAPPYEIVAIGGQVDLLASLQDDSYLDIYRAAAADPEVRVGWSIELEASATAPAYDGVVNLNYAVPLDS